MLFPAGTIALAVAESAVAAEPGTCAEPAADWQWGQPAGAAEHGHRRG
jgi:hypothetical protein